MTEQSMRVKIQKMLPITILLLLLSTSSIALQSDFISPSTNWYQIKTKDRQGMQKLLTIRSNNKEQTYLYWMSPNSETNIQSHSKMEDVIVVQGSLYWLNENRSIQKKLMVGDAVDRKSNVKGGK